MPNVSLYVKLFDSSVIDFIYGIKSLLLPEGNNDVITPAIERKSMTEATIQLFQKCIGLWIRPRNIAGSGRRRDDAQ